MENKVYPLTCHEHSEGKQMYNSTLSPSWRLRGIGGQRHALAALTLGNIRSTHCTGGWVGLSAGLDRCGKPLTHRDSNPGPSSL